MVEKLQRQPDRIFWAERDQRYCTQKKQKEEFHSMVAKALFLANRRRPDIQPTIVYLCPRVRAPTTTDWKKLVHLMGYLSGSQEDVRTMAANQLRVFKWFVDASFGVHPDYKSHTGVVGTMGTGVLAAHHANKS